MTSAIERQESARILPLPEDAKAQIKSSIAINTLNDVVLGLVKNSLDAGSSKIGIELDLVRACCVVEDDGHGISPQEFKAEGGLLRLHYTSRYNEKRRKYGRSGGFLHAIGALSTLTVTSRHSDYTSLNAITMHRSTVLSRQTPAPNSDVLLRQSYGTRVIVRDLFGNMPVRVKHRALLSNDSRERQRNIEALKKALVALLLAWSQPVTIRISDMPSSIVTKLSTNDGGAYSTITSNARASTSHATLHKARSLLSQAAYITPRDWTDWTPVAADGERMSVRGAISLQPAPTKQCQFISIDIHPVLATAHNEVYDEINRLFTNSAFGFDENVTSEDNSSRCLSKGKAIDRWPMFVLQIHLATNAARYGIDQLVTTRANGLPVVVELLTVVVTAWLSRNMFRPRTRKLESPSKKLRRDTQSHIAVAYSASSDQTSRLQQIAVSSSHLEDQLDRQSPHRLESLADRSRIKSGRQSFFDSHWSGKSASSKPTSLATSAAIPLRLPEDTPLTGSVSPFYSRTLAAGALNVNPPGTSLEETTDFSASSSPGEESRQIDESAVGDESFQWRKASQGVTYTSNARTGMTMMAHCDPSHQGTASRTIRRTQAASTHDTATEQPWLDGFLKTYDNPVFRQTELSIPQVTTSLSELDGTTCSSKQTWDATRTPSKLSKASLLHAQVIRQVDQKFILLKTDIDDTSTLVLVDQHAADERFQVEKLMKDLCTASDTRISSEMRHEAGVKTSLLSKQLHFQVSMQDVEQIRKAAAYLASWGILYNIITVADAGQGTLIIEALPPVIVERCKHDPAALIALIRTEAWRLAEQKSPTVPVTVTEESSNQSWLKKIASCPPSLLDLLNSRACRSAIMFNDRLTPKECDEVIKRLSGCAFPFQCAHGRPSMVPLVELGGLGWGLENHGKDSSRGSFSESFRAWRTQF